MAAVSKLTMWIGAIGLVWNLIGVAAFVAQARANVVELPDAQRLFYETMPIWAKTAFFLAVTMGTLGCIALLAGQPWARWMFGVSLAGIVLQNLHAFVLSNGVEAFGAAGIAMPVVVFLVALGLLVYSSSL